MSLYGCIGLMVVGKASSHERWVSTWGRVVASVIRTGVATEAALRLQSRSSLGSLGSIAEEHAEALTADY